MNKFVVIASTASLIIFSAFGVQAQRASIAPQDKGNPLPEVVSGYYFANQESKSLQDDDFDNPGFLWVGLGEEEWTKVEGRAGRSCASCHNDAADTMKEAGISYPKYNKEKRRVINLEQRINICRTDNMKARPFKWESNELLGITAYVRNQARGMPVKISVAPEAKPLFEEGKKLYYERLGQLNMSCAHCHEGQYGNKIRADLLSQGHLNGFPTYRLGWQRIGSAQRRFKACNTLLRAEPFEYGSREYTALELYIAWRGNGLPVETPAVRR